MSNCGLSNVYLYVRADDVVGDKVPRVLSAIAAAHPSLLIVAGAEHLDVASLTFLGEQVKGIYRTAFMSAPVWPPSPEALAAFDEIELAASTNEVRNTVGDPSWAHPNMTLTLRVRKANDLDEIEELLKPMKVGTIKFSPVIVTADAPGLDGKGFVQYCASALRLYGILNRDDRPVKALLPWAFLTVENLRLGRTNCTYMQHIAVHSNGDMTLCGDRERSITSFGNVLDEPFDVIRERAMCHSFYATTEYSGVCSMCMFAKYCANQCRSEAFFRTGSSGSSYAGCQLAYEAGVFPSWCLVREPHAQ